MEKTKWIVLLLILAAVIVPAQEIEIELTGPGMYADADGWQPFQPAFNLMPYAGGAFVLFGLANIVKENTTAGILQVIIGAGLFFGGMLLHG